MGSRLSHSTLKHRLSPDPRSGKVAVLEDTTYVVAGVEPRRRKFRRFEPDGELVGEYVTLQDAILAKPWAREN